MSFGFYANETVSVQVDDSAYVRAWSLDPTVRYELFVDRSGVRLSEEVAPAAAGRGGNGGGQSYVRIARSLLRNFGIRQTTGHAYYFIQVGSKCAFGEGEIKFFTRDVVALADYVRTRIRSSGNKYKTATPAAEKRPAVAHGVEVKPPRPTSQIGEQMRETHFQQQRPPKPPRFPSGEGAKLTSGCKQELPQRRKIGNETLMSTAAAKRHSFNMHQLGRSVTLPPSTSPPKSNSQTNLNKAKSGSRLKNLMRRFTKNKSQSTVSSNSQNSHVESDSDDSFEDDQYAAVDSSSSDSDYEPPYTQHEGEVPECQPLTGGKIQPVPEAKWHTLNLVEGTEYVVDELVAVTQADEYVGLDGGPEHVFVGEESDAYAVPKEK